MSIAMIISMPAIQQWYDLENYQETMLKYPLIAFAMRLL